MTRERVTGLEVLRGYAALSIIIFHVEYYICPLPGGYAKSVIGTFVYAVPIFFALSAFSLLYGYSSRLFDERSLTRFYLRRFFRLAPLFYVMVLFYCVYRVIRGMETSASEIVLNLTFMFPFLPGKHHSLVYAGWSIGVEWIFYFAFPLIALFVRSVALSAMMFAMSILLSLAFALASRDIYEPSMVHNLMYFQAGALAYAIMSRSAIRLEHGSVVAIIAASIALFALNSVMNPHMAPDVLFAFVAALWVSCAFSGLPRWIDNHVSQYLGRVSYSIYLGGPFAQLLLHENGFYDLIYKWHAHPQIVLFVDSSATIAITVLFAAVTYRYVESPGIRLGEWILNKRSAMPPLEAPAHRW